MRKTIKLLCAGLLMLAAGCKKDNMPDVAGQKFSDSKGTQLTLSTNQWKTTPVYNGGQVSVTLGGATNADKLTVVTYGDGVNTEMPVTLSDKTFNGEFVISFSGGSRQSGTFTISTKLKAYRGDDVLEVPINSGDLKY